MIKIASGPENAGMNVIDTEIARPKNPEAYRYGGPLPEHSSLLEQLLKEARLQDLFEAFYLLTDIPVCVIDLKANVLISSHWRRICVQFHRVHPITLERCIASDVFLGAELEKGASYAIHKCGNGMTDCAAPIVIDGEHIANVFVGQFLTEPPDEGFFRAQAADLGFDEQEYLSAVHEIPVVDRARAPRLLEVLTGFTRIITRLAIDRKNAVESQARLLAILNTIPQSVFWKDPEGSYLGCNPAFAKAAGLDSPAAIVGKNDFDMPWRNKAKAYRADDAEVIASTAPKLHIIEPLQQADGSQLIIDTSKVPLVDAQGRTYGVLGIYDDVTERAQVAQQLAESERKYRELVENANSIILRWGRDGRITFLNEFGLRFFGHTLDEVVGRNVVDVLVPGEESTGRDLKHLMEQICADPKAFEHSTNENVKRSGERVWVSWTNKIVLDERGEVKELLAIGSDITERRRAEQALRRSMEQSIRAIAGTIEARDRYTAGHQQNVATLAVAIARKMGLKEEQIQGLGFAASIHDVGKIQIPSEILAKPGKLTEIEFMMIKTHPEAGYQIMKDIEFPWPIAEIIRQHHERMDGSGYPRGLKGEQIILEARILAVADVVESLSSHRPYRAALGREAALDEIERGRGIVYDAAVTDACLKLIREDGSLLS